MYACGLGPGFVHCQREASVLQFLVDVDRGSRQEDHDRAFNVVFLRFHAPGMRILAGAGDGEFAFALQELEGVARLLGSFFLDYGKDTVFEILLAQVVEALPGHG